MAGMERSSLHERRERLTQLVPKIGPVSFARDRVLPVAPALEPLLPEAGLIRGSVIGCQGPTALSLALALVAGPSAAGSWVAVVGVPSLGLRAAGEVGIALDRLVMVADSARDVGEGPWANVVSALIDGFDLIVMRTDLRAGAARRLQARLQTRGAVLVLIGDPGPFSCDITFTSDRGTWEGLGHGSGRLERRRLSVTAHGRRLPRERRLDVWLPGAAGQVDTVHDTVHDTIHDTRHVRLPDAPAAAYRQTG
ncbi:MAG: hypothetical protein JWN62_1968 [Acidimicrobiales bacterium]|nr:hypothetical protein [Acidimicrobiales bacterium]